MTSSCSVADAAAAPSFASARRREAALPAQTVTAALCNLRSVSQWVRRVYIPHPRRETNSSLSSPATAVCIPHLCESRPHAARCACEVHGMKCGWRCPCERSAQRSAAVSRQHRLGWFWKGAHRNAGSERNVFRRAERASGEEQRSVERRKTA